MSIAALCAVMNASIPDIGPASLIVLTRLADYASPNGTGARPSIETIASRSNLSRRTVQIALGWLSEANLIKCTKHQTGRGHVNVWAINLPLLERYAVKSRAKDEELPPDFGPAGAPDCEICEDKGCSICTLSGGERVQDLQERVQNLHERVQNLHPNLLEPVLTLDAREKNLAPSQKCVRPEGRTFGKSGSKEAAAVEALIADLDQPIDRANFDAWASLVAAIVARRQSDEARAWLHRRSGNLVGLDRVIVAANDFKLGKIKTSLGGVLDEFGWRVVLAGSG
jgi:hypothetical protein